MYRVSALAATLLLLATADAARSGEAADFRLSQAVQGDGAARIHAYLDVWDQTSEPVGDLPVAALSGTLGGRAVAVRRLVPFRDSGEGVAYIFSVDISKSLSPQDYAEIKRALTRWIDSLGPNDRAAILTFGTQTRIAVDFTADAGALRSELEKLAPTDMTTMLYRGLHDAIEMSSRRDPGLPARRVLVVLTDGVDDHSALAPEDVLVALREHPLPIYVVAFGRSGSSEPRELLQRFATNSGGLLVAAGGGEFETAYAEVRDAIDRVWVAELDCPDCEPDGGVNRLQVNLHLADRVLSKGIDLRLLPPLEATAATAPGATAAVPGAPPAQPSAAAATAESAPAGRPGWMLWSAVAAAAAVILLGAAVAARRLRAGAPAEGDGAPAPKRRRARQHLTRRERKQLDIPLDSEPLVPPVALCLTVVRGTGEGKEHRFLLHRRGVLGSGSKSDFQVEEPELATEQVELFQEVNGVYARNLSRSQPTLVNGAPLLETKPLANGDLLGNRGFIVRVRLG